MQQQDEQAIPFEAALNQTLADAEAALKVATRLIGALKGLQKAANEGDMRKLRSAPEAIRQGVVALEEQTNRLASSWDFDEEAYLRDGGYVKELLREARRQNLRMTLQDDRLYSYPLLIGVAPADRALKIDRKLERRIRPSLLVELLKRRQVQQPRFRTMPFLEALRSAYGIAVDRRSQERRFGSVVPLRELYDLLTMFPGQNREYTLPEFTRDIYLLDQTGDLTARDGATAEFHASTGTKSEHGVLSIVTQTGAEKRYFGISFSGAN